MADTLTVADLATSLTEVLDRVRGGAEFAIERDGEIIATIAPPSEKPGMTLREVAVELARLPRLDDDFGADIEAARAILLPAKVPHWPD